jgi:hypothetical protein
LGRREKHDHYDLGGSLRTMPNFSGFRNRFLRMVAAILLLILLFSSTTSNSHGKCRGTDPVRQSYGRGARRGHSHLINPLKSVQKLSVQPGR